MSDVRYAVLYNFSYMAIGALTPMIGQYMAGIGFSGAQIGTVTATGTAVAIAASTFWGDRYGRSSKKSGILILLCLCASLMCLILSGVKEYVPFLAVFGIMYFFQAPVMSLSDAFTVESGRSFGPLRAWGAVGFALGTFFTGLCSEACGYSSIFWFYIGSFLITAAAVAGIRKDAAKKPVHENGPHGRGGYLSVLRNRKLKQLILCAFFLGGTNVANNTYFSFLYIEGGGTAAGVGTAMLLMVGSEVPFMAWCEKLASKLTPERLLLMSMALSAVRFLLYGAGLPWWLLICLFFTQVAVNGIILVVFVKYAASLAEKGYESFAISAYYIIGSNLSTICCQFTGGILLDVCGACGVYLFFGMFNMCGVILYMIFGLYRHQGKRS